MEISANLLCVPLHSVLFWVLYTSGMLAGMLGRMLPLLYSGKF